MMLMLIEMKRTDRLLISVFVCLLYCTSSFISKNNVPVVIKHLDPKHTSAGLFDNARWAFGPNLRAIQTNSESSSQQGTRSTSILDRTKQVKEDLLELFPIQSLDDKIKADSLIEALENSYFPIHTLDFFNLGIQGKWQLVYSTVPIRSPASELDIPQLTQEIIPNGQNGTLVNSFTWEETEMESNELISQGNFSISAEYTVTPRSHLDISVKKHLMLPEKMPEDPELTINRFQSTIPPEFMNPDDCLVETKYCDVDMRIVQFMGENLSGIKNVFLRDGELDLS